MDSKILVRIKKLLALASNNPEAGEAAAAAAKAADLLAEHKLSMAALDGVNTDPETTKVGERWVSFGGSLWIQWLAVSVGRATGTKPILMRVGGKSGLVFVGKADDVATAIEMMGWLTTQIKSLAARYAREQGVGGKTVMVSFANGASQTVCHRLNESFNARKAANPTFGALVVAENALVDQYLAEKYGKLRAGSGKSSTRDHSAYRAGAEAGKSVALGHRAVANPAPRLN